MPNRDPAGQLALLLDQLDARELPDGISLIVYAPRWWPMPPAPLRRCAEVIPSERYL